MARLDALVALETTLNKRRRALGDKIEVHLTKKGSTVPKEVSDELASTLRALDRMKQGSYGMCERCQEKIPVTRLKTLPLCALCAKCQNEQDQQPLFVIGRIGLDPHPVSDWD